MPKILCHYDYNLETCRKKLMAFRSIVVNITILLARTWKAEPLTIERRALQNY